MARAKPVSTDELQTLANTADEMHFQLSDVQSRAEKAGLLDSGSLEQAAALMRLSRAASDLAYSIVVGERANQDRRDLEAELRAAL
jgi:hypothetical protein